MASDRCPSCASHNTRALDKMSPHDQVRYRRCDACTHVWVTFADGRPVHHVTPPATNNEVMRRVDAAIQQCRQAIQKVSEHS